MQEKILVKQMSKCGLLMFFMLFVGLNACKQAPELGTYEIEKNIIAENAMVVSAHPLASQVGLDILENGGNAVDAAIAVQFALAVVYPRAGNIGGGGLMVIRDFDGRIDALDYREKAPAAASRDMYLDSLENVVKGLSTAGHLAAGVPGTTAGMYAAHAKYGTMSWSSLVSPAVQLAREGFYITNREAERLNEYEESFREHCTILPNAFTKEEGDWKKGDMLRQGNLAATMERIEKDGKAGFYTGETAKLIVAEMGRGNGMISLKDLQDYEAVWRVPVTTSYKDYTLISMPPPSSGGIALAQMLEMIEPYPLGDYGFHSKEAIHLMTEVERRAYADRAKHLGDSDFYPVPLDSLIAPDYIKARMSDYSPEAATKSNDIAAGDFKIALESFETTHTSIVDQNGMAVSVTTTINSNYGNKVVVGGAGFFLNNEMDDFSAKPGVPNQFGLLGAEANSIVPGKRMLSSMTPTIIEKNDQLFMVLGAPGGSTIITAVFQTFVNVAEFGMPLEEAVWSPRFHHQWFPDQIILEKDAFTTETRAELEKMGHSFYDRKYLAVIKAIQVLEDGKLKGVGDKRNPDDSAMGY